MFSLGTHQQHETEKHHPHPASHNHNHHHHHHHNLFNANSNKQQLGNAASSSAAGLQEASDHKLMPKDRHPSFNVAYDLAAPASAKKPFGPAGDGDDDDGQPYSKSTPTNKTQKSRSDAEWAESNSWNLSPNHHHHHHHQQQQQQPLSPTITNTTNSSKYNRRFNSSHSTAWTGSENNKLSTTKLRTSGPIETKLASRLPRGVSMIPRQVNANLSLSPTHQSNYQQEGSTLEATTQITGIDLGCYNSSSSSSSSRYLTFSKDQATSHFEQLKEELGGGLKLNNNSNKAVDELDRLTPGTTTTTTITTSPILEAANLEKKTKEQETTAEIGRFHHKTAIANGTQDYTTTNSSHHTSNDNASSSVRQQPICEAFIMTGQSMLKLSCNESGNTNNNNINNNNKNNNITINSSSNNNNSNINHLKQTEARMKSLSLNKLNGNNVSKEISHLRSNDEIATGSSKEHTNCGNIQMMTAPSPIKQFVPIETTSTAEVKANNAKTQPASICASKCESSTLDGEAQSSEEDNKRPNNKLNISLPLKRPTPTGLEISVMKEPLGDGQMMIGAEQRAGPRKQVSADTEVVVSVASSLTTTTTQNNNGSPVTPICNDRDSARRLALRLYNLSGFKRSDVCHHLAKNNPFSQMVAEEYLNLFDFRSMKLDSALRKFLSKLQLTGETQERERMLNQFSQRYYYCNKDKFPNSDTVQTLVCALILLNTDLHGNHNRKKRSKLSLGAFIDGLGSSLVALPRNITGSNMALDSHQQQQQPYTFPRHLLVDLYESIKKRPLKCSDDKCDMTSFEAELDRIYKQQLGATGNRSNTLPTRRFAPGSNAPSSTLSASSRRHLKQGLNRLDGQLASGGGGGADDSEVAIEFKSGFVNRKRVFEANGNATSKGRRSWRRVNAILQDLRLIMRLNSSNSTQFESNQQNDKLTAKQKAKLRAEQTAQDMKNTIRIHHTFAKRSITYTKREFVFHLKLADQSEYLIQANNEQDMNSWIDTINFASACLSSPALSSAVINSQRQPQKSQRPVLPAAYTKLSYWEQLVSHQERLQRHKEELEEHLAEAPNTRNANKRFKTEFIERIAHLKQEIERYTVYVELMRKKSNSPEAIILSKHPQIASSFTPSEEMILSLPSFAPPNALPLQSSPSKDGMSNT